MPLQFFVFPEFSRDVGGGVDAGIFFVEVEMRFRLGEGLVFASPLQILQYFRRLRRTRDGGLRELGFRCLTPTQGPKNGRAGQSSPMHWKQN